TQVIETRMPDNGDSIRRRRRCQACDKRFTTYERIELVMPTVVKKDGSREEFERAKLEGSINLALRKRPVSTQAVSDAISRVIDKISSSGQREVASDRIGGIIMEELQRLDHVGYVRFASVYRDFKDLEAFTEAIREVKPTREARPRARRKPR
ncbi:MAG: transcriptional regulator NrdR, partial [Burkholderiaceae bacterium]